MSCDVCLYADDDIDNAFYFAAVLTARKPHVCEECRATILPGAQYERAVGKSDGEMFSFKTCVLCREVRTVFYCGGAFYHGTLWEEMESQAFPDLTTSSECFRDLSPAGKAVVMDRWNAWKFPASPTVGSALSSGAPPDPQGASGPRP